MYLFLFTKGKRLDLGYIRVTLQCMLEERDVSCSGSKVIGVLSQAIIHHSRGKAAKAYDPVGRTVALNPRCTALDTIVVFAPGLASKEMFCFFFSVKQPVSPPPLEFLLIETSGL